MVRSMMTALNDQERDKRMISSKTIRLSGALLMCLLGWFVVPTQSQQTSLIKVDGSSTVFPITEAVAEEFQKSSRGAARVTVGISGTGGGFKKFCRGESDVQDASRPILTDEMEVCRKNGVQYYELPVALDALTIAVSPQST